MTTVLLIGVCGQARAMIPTQQTNWEANVSGPEIHPDERSRTAEPAAGPRPSKEALRQVLGVFAGTGRGARIGATVGTCGCFLALMAYAVRDAMARGHDGMPPGATLIAWAFLAVWFLVVSLIFGGVGGAVLGAMAGAFFPVRRRR